MLIQLAFLCLLRYAADTVVDSYVANAKYCNELLVKAKETQVESIRNAYCVEVVEADQKAVLSTLQQYHLTFLASNETYATFEEVLNYSCRIPSSLDVVLQWTAGVIPVTVGFFVYKIALHIFDKWQSLKRRTVSLPEEKETADEGEEKDEDAPPRIMRNRNRRPPLHKTRSQVRDLQHIRSAPPVITVTEKQPTISEKTEALITSISPGLRKRLMGSRESEV